MRTHFRCFWLGIVFLAVTAAVTSCKKPKEPAPEKAAEPWVVAAVLEWGLWEDDNGPAIVLYSDRRLIIKRLPADKTLTVGSTYWTRVLSPEEFSKIDEAAVLTLRTSALMESYEFGTFFNPGAESCLYFGLPGKGMTVKIEDVRMTTFERDLPKELVLHKDSNHLPQNLWEYCKLLVGTTRGHFVPWTSASLTIEFYAEPVVQARGVRWPDEWPKPQFSSTVASNGRTYVKLDANRLSQLQKLFGGKPEGEAVGVEIDGKQYAAEYRFYFPGEENWREVFPRFAIFNIETDSSQIPVSRSEYSSPSKPKDAFAR